jgi:hypothetical protein
MILLVIHLDKLKKNTSLVKMKLINLKIETFDIKISQSIIEFIFFPYLFYSHFHTYLCISSKLKA